VSSQLLSSRTLAALVVVVAVLVLLAVVARFIYRAVHPPNKPLRKRKRRTF